MTFLSISEVMKTLCSYRLVLKGKAGKETTGSSKLEFLEKFLGNNFALSDLEDNTFGPFNRGDHRFSFVERSISNLPKFTRARFRASDGFFLF